MAIFMMLSGIGIFALLVTNLAQRRLLRRESKLKSKSDAQASVLDQESKTAIKKKIDGIEMLTEDDFDRLTIMMKGVRHILPEESKISYKCSRCDHVSYSKPKFCSNCGRGAY